MKIVMLVLAIIITIAYFTFSIWHIFIAKKQVVVSVIDCLYFISLGFIFILTNNIKLILLVFLMAFIWERIINPALERNYTKKYK